jgi:cell division protein ZapA
MPEVSVDINGRKYRMACEPGQEDHLVGLAERFNRVIDSFKGSFGEIGDNRLTVMAGIAVLDELTEAERRIATLEAALAAAEVLATGAEARIAAGLNAASERLEAVAEAINQVVADSRD